MNRLPNGDKSTVFRRYLYCNHGNCTFQVTGIDLTEKDIDMLIKRLDKDGDGEVDYG